MSITDKQEKINPVVHFDTVQGSSPEGSAKIYYRVKPFYTLILCVVIATIFFALGRLSILEEQKTPIKIIRQADQSASAIYAFPDQSTSQNSEVTSSANTSSDEVIASKNGTKYYFPWCGSAKNIKPENQVRFASTALARAAGYSPAANCKGLK